MVTIPVSSSGALRVLWKRMSSCKSIPWATVFCFLPEPGCLGCRELEDGQVWCAGQVCHVWHLQPKEYRTIVIVIYHEGTLLLLKIDTLF